MVEPLVVDSSVFLSSNLIDEEDPSAMAAMDHVVVNGGIAPRIWWYEVRNALLMSERRGRISRQDVAGTLADSRTLRVEIDDFPDESSLFALARRFKLTIYDAAFLEVAFRRSLPLATLDKRLQAAARELGVTLFEESRPGPA